MALVVVLASVLAPPFHNDRIGSPSLPSLSAPIDVAAAAPLLLRDPYLTDDTGSSAMVNLATDTSSPAPIVSWGLAAGNCTSPPSSVTATYVTTFGTNDRQFKAQLSGLQPNTAYCYRVVQAGVDLLGSAPVFNSALPSGATDPFTFAVIGDWGAGTADEAKVLTQIASAKPAFIVTVGDNVYNSGTQTEYGDLNGGNAFGPQYWPKVGRTIPAFPATGNHGFSGSLPYFQNWPQDATIAACAQGGCRYQRDTYCCTGTLGTTSKSYPSSWYAFDWGNTRFYVLDGAFGDSTGAYLGDRQAHFNGPVAGCPICGAELDWLTNDLASHPAAHKFAFWHYPLYADSSSQGSDGFLNGPQNLEGVLASYGVNIVFNGHAHFYERNYPQIPGSPLVTYVTGGGGDTLGGVSGHSSFDAYAKAIFHFLRVTVNGSSVTVTPIDENDVTFDAQTYTFAPPSSTNYFSISASPSSLSVVQGQGATSTISTAVVSGAAQSVTLSASDLPTGAAASFNPGSVTAGASSTLSITTGASTPAGTYTVTVTGTGTSATHTTSVFLTVNAPVANDFSISASPSSLSVVQGQGATSSISTTVTSGSAQAVTLSASGLPSGAAASFNPSSVTAGASSTLSITTAASTPAGTYTATVTGTGTSAAHTTSVFLTVNAPVANDFSISASPSSLSVVQGQGATSTISTTVTSGSAQAVTLSAGGLPSGAAASFNPSSVTAGASSTLSITTAASTPVGTYALTVTGTGTSATHATSISLTVNAPVANDLSISASPNSLSVNPGQNGTSTVSTTVTSGSAQAVSLSASGLPAGATASFNPASMTAGGSSTLTIGTSASTAAGTYIVTVTATGTSVSHATSLTLTVIGSASAPQLVQATGARETVSSTSLTATFPASTAAGHLLVLSASVYTGATNQITSVTDSANNSWIKIGAFYTASHFSDGEMWYAANAAPMTSVTVTVATATAVVMEVLEFSGLATSNPLDAQAGASNTGTLADSGPATPTVSTDLAIGFLAGHSSTQAMTMTAVGYAAQAQQTSSNAGATPVSVITGYQVVSSTSAQDFTGSFSAAMYWADGIALFKAA